MRGFFILSLLLGLLYYGFLNKEAADEQIPLLRSIKHQVSGIAERENERANTAKNCSGGDDNSAVDCLQQSYDDESDYRTSESDFDFEDSKPKSSKKRASSSSNSIAKRVGKFSGGSDIQGF